MFEIAVLGIFPHFTDDPASAFLRARFSDAFRGTERRNISSDDSRRLFVKGRIERTAADGGKRGEFFIRNLGKGNYDIDIHNPEGSGTSHYYFRDGEYYTIPYCALIPKGARNLLVAGRCISATHEAQASIRIMPIVTCIGEAAGTAASLAARGKQAVSEISVPELRETLYTAGALIHELDWLI